MSSLLEEAIVDATALKDAALKNAEAVVLEKYSTEVRGAVDALLEQEGGDPFALEEEEGVEGADASFIADVPYAFQNEEIDAPAEDELVEIDFSELKTRIAEEEAAGIETPEADLNDALELAEEITDTMLEEDGGYITDTDLEDDSREDAASLAGAKDREELQEDEDVALTEEMISDLIEELVVDMTPRPQGWASVNSADNSVEQANNDAMAAAQAAHLEEEEEEEEVETAPDVVSDAELYEAKISQFTVSTRELRALLIESKDQLTKLNLENAKLVYQNKALSSASLNERQKDKIVEAVQSANSVEEANMIFETIQNAVGITSSNNSRDHKHFVKQFKDLLSLLLNSKKNNEATIDPNWVECCV